MPTPTPSVSLTIPALNVINSALITTAVLFSSSAADYNYNYYNNVNSVVQYSGLKFPDDVSLLSVWRFSSCVKLWIPQSFEIMSVSA